MKKEFSSGWKRSVQPRKQRKYRYNAPLNVKHRFLSAHLSKEMRARHGGARSIPLRKGDIAKVMRGQFKKKAGAVERVDLKKTKVYIAGIEIIKKDGSKIMYPLDPSNLMITDLNLDDKKRQKILERKKRPLDKVKK